MMATFRALEAYDPTSNTWSVLPSMPVCAARAGGRRGRRPATHMVSGELQSAGTGVHRACPFPRCVRTRKITALYLCLLF